MSKWSLLREFYGLSQSDIANEFNITKQAVSKFELEGNKSRCKKFYTHENLYKLFKKKYGDTEPILDYIKFILDTVDIEDIVAKELIVK